MVIAVSVFYRIPGLNELWIEFGTGKSLRFIPVHEIAIKIGEANAVARSRNFTHFLFTLHT